MYGLQSKETTAFIQKFNPNSRLEIPAFVTSALSSIVPACKNIDKCREHSEHGREKK